MEETQESAMEKMRAEVKKLGSSIEGETEGSLMRFLVARSMDPKKAARMFVQWKSWRAEIAPLGYIPDDEVLDELRAQKIFLQGLSRRGFGVFIILARKHFAPKDFLQLKRFVVHILDKTLLSCKGHAEEGKEKIVVVLDLQQISLANIDVRSLITGFQTLQVYTLLDQETGSALRPDGVPGLTAGLLSRATGKSLYRQHASHFCRCLEDCFVLLNQDNFRQGSNCEIGRREDGDVGRDRRGDASSGVWRRCQIGAYPRCEAEIFACNSRLAEN